MSILQKISFFVLAFGITLISLPFLLGDFDYQSYIYNYYARFAIFTIMVLGLLTYNYIRLTEFRLKKVLQVNLVIFILLVVGKTEPNVTAFAIIILYPIAITALFIGGIRYRIMKKQLKNKS